MVKEKKGKEYNFIKIGNMEIYSTKTDITILLKIADKILKKHKDVVKEKEMWELPQYIE